MRTYTWIASRVVLFTVCLFTFGISVRAQVTISPATSPVVNQGQTFTFTATVAGGGGVTWSCPGCRGSINPSTGVYTAPASVKSQQSYGGFQVLPNDHIFNTRIDSLPVNANSGTWIAGAGTVPLNYFAGYPVNYGTSGTPTQSLIFNYTAGNNRPFYIPPYPNVRIENGYFAPLADDRHLFFVATDTGLFQEIYNWQAAGTVSGCATCTAASGDQYQNSSYMLPANGGANAGGTSMMPLTLRLQELENAANSGGTINHALQFTLQNGYICGSSNANVCGGNAGGTRHIWPATAEAFSGGGSIPYGARFRLKSSFNISGFSPIAQVLLKQLQQYGIILSDGGLGWQITTEYTKWPPAYLAAFNQISGAGITASNFEAVDESSLEISPTSGATTTSETVVATSISNPSASSRRQVVLTGVTINLPLDERYIQAGAAAQQFTAFVNGSSNTATTWSMNPVVGNLTSGGAYTPPATVSAATLTTVTATSAADPTVSASMTVTILPAGAIRIIMGQSTPYKDSLGNVWQASTGDDGGHPYNNGGTWPNTPDIQLYEVPYFSYSDMRFDITVPNGSYLITGKFAETETIATVGSRLMDLEAQGQVVDPNVDIFASAGGFNKPIDFTIPATVTNGHLAYVLRHVVGDFTIISALQIVPNPSGSGPNNVPEPPPSISIIQVK
jgi:hypothetical protein